MKIAVVGGNGFLGKKIISVLSENGHDCRSFSKGSDNILDITSYDSVEKALNDYKPDLVVNSAALTNVDYCELHPDEAQSVNYIGAKNLGEYCRKNSLPFVQISTDYVFNGIKGNYSEEDECSPVNVYGNTKLMAEKYITENLENYIILRVAILYGYNDDNDKETFVNRIINKISKKELIDVYFDQYGTPTFIDDVPAAIEFLLKNNQHGIFHLVDPQKSDRYSFGLYICNVFSLDKKFLNPISIEEFETPAKRPRDSSLSTKKIESLGFMPTRIEDGLEKMKKQQKR
ncbi:MAG: dTDP-4-dehydrorhamnose reductase [Thermoplasmata archaeon]